MQVCSQAVLVLHLTVLIFSHDSPDVFHDSVDVLHSQLLLLMAVLILAGPDSEAAAL